jgi:LacI family transcriptional regulator
MSVNEQPKTGKKDRVTIRTVAAHAGVSVAAVSKVMRNAYGVSDNLRARWLDLNRRRWAIGRRRPRVLRGRSFTIGLLLVDIRNPFLPEVIAGVNEVLTPSHYQAMIGVGEARTQLETSLIESMIDYKMDGLILVAPRLPSEVIERFAEQIPIVAVGYHDEASTAFDTVNADDQRGAEIAVEALIERGYNSIAMLSLDAREGHKVSVVRQREIGYRRAARQAGLTAASAPITAIPVESPGREEACECSCVAPTGRALSSAGAIWTPSRFSAIVRYENQRSRRACCHRLRQLADGRTHPSQPGKHRSIRPCAWRARYRNAAFEDRRSGSGTIARQRAGVHRPPQPGSDCRLSRFKVQQTQKSFSIIVLATPRPAPVSPKRAARSSAGRRATLSIDLTRCSVGDRDERRPHPCGGVDRIGCKHLLVAGRQATRGNVRALTEYDTAGGAVGQIGALCRNLC